MSLITTTPGVSDELHEALRRELVRLAQDEDTIALREAERDHYWEPTPVTVAIHRQCAAALRAAAEELFVPVHASVGRD